MKPSRALLASMFLSLVGLGLCLYLGFIHIALLRGELVGGAGCGAAGTAFNCHAVLASPRAYALGIPLAFWGALGYLVTFSLAVIAWQFADWRQEALNALTLAGGLFVLIDVALGTTMVTRIGYLCRFCLATYGVNVLLFLSAALANAQSLPTILSRLPTTIRDWRPSLRHPVVWGFWSTVVTGAIGIVAVDAASTYAVLGAVKTFQKQLLDFANRQQPVQVDITGDPLLGTPDGRFRIVEFSDFLCPSCQHAWTYNPILLAGHRSEASFVFKHYPLDQECNPTLERSVHPGACQLAAATECAHEQGKFWELHDRMFQGSPNYSPTKIEPDAAALGLNMETFRACLSSGRGMDAVRRDVAEAIRIKISRTPTYSINGMLIEGAITPVTFEQLIQTLKEKP